MSDVVINCDGGSRGNPGEAAIGIVIRRDDEVLEKIKKKIGKTTNNIAEYTALIKSIEAASKYTKGEVEIIMDSELVVRQVRGIYAVRAKHLLPFYQKVKSLESNFRKVTYKNVSRWDKFQSEADKLVNEALDD